MLNNFSIVIFFWRKFMQQISEFKTCKEAAKRLLTSEAQIFEWVRNGTLSAPVVARIGRKILINPQELESWLQRGGSMQKSAAIKIAA
jgi:excisionase family DNA binding protein